MDKVTYDIELAAEEVEPIIVLKHGVAWGSFPPCQVRTMIDVQRVLGMFDKMIEKCLVAEENRNEFFRIKSVREWLEEARDEILE